MSKIDLKLAEGSELSLSTDVNDGPEFQRQHELNLAIALAQTKGSEGIANVLQATVGGFVVADLLEFKESEERRRELMQNLFLALGNGESLDQVVAALMNVQVEEVLVDQPTMPVADKVSVTPTKPVNKKAIFRGLDQRKDEKYDLKGFGDYRKRYKVDKKLVDDFKERILKKIQDWSMVEALLDIDLPELVRRNVNLEEVQNRVIASLGGEINLVGEYGTLLARYVAGQEGHDFSEEKWTPGKIASEVIESDGLFIDFVANILDSIDFKLWVKNILSGIIVELRNTLQSFSDHTQALAVEIRLRLTVLRQDIQDLNKLLKSPDYSEDLTSQASMSEEVTNLVGEVRELESTLEHLGAEGELLEKKSLRLISFFDILKAK